MTRIISGADDNRTPGLDTGHIPQRNPSAAAGEKKRTMSDQSEPMTRPEWQAPLLSGLVGVATGAAIGAGTGMWWMMGVLGGVFPVFGWMYNRRGG